MKTYSLKATDIERKWYLIDASEAPLGRLASTVASLLIGKRKPGFTPHVDNGDYVVVINASRLVTTGNKRATKLYSRHSGFPGGLHQKTLNDLAESDPSQIIRHAVRGMLPVNKLRKARLERLKIYNDAEHQHQGQSPQHLPLIEGEK